MSQELTDPSLFLKGKPGQFKWLPYILIANMAFLADQVTKFLAMKHLTPLFKNSDSSGFVTFSEQISRFLWEHYSHSAPKTNVDVISGFWEHTYVQNFGSAFGFLSNFKDSWWQPVFFNIVAVFVFIFIFKMFKESFAEQTYLRFGLALIIGGAIGNIFDRLRLGYVIDFIHWYLGELPRPWFSWPVFNVADSCITIGVGFFILDAIITYRKEKAYKASLKK